MTPPKKSLDREIVCLCQPFAPKWVQMNPFDPIKVENPMAYLAGGVGFLTLFRACFSYFKGGLRVGSLSDLGKQAFTKG